MKELLKQQIAWRDGLQASGVHVGLPSFQPPRGLTVVRSRQCSRIFLVRKQCSRISCEYDVLDLS